LFVLSGLLLSPEAALWKRAPFGEEEEKGRSCRRTLLRREKMRSLARRFNQFTAKLLDLPKDVAMDLPRLTMIGNVQLYIENHRGVLHFSSDRLLLALPKGSLEVQGKQLVIRAILTEEVLIEGVIGEIKFNP
jgi:sporulation protein YqfC